MTRREMVSQRRSSAIEKEASSVTEPASYRRSRSINPKTTKKSQDNKSERRIIWETKKRRRRLGSILGVVIAAGLGVVVLLLQITVYITVETPDVRSQTGSERYIAILNDYYAKRPIERLRFALNDSKLYTYFIERAPEVKNIRIIGSGQIATSKAQVTFRKPIVEWSAAGKTYYVDDTGVTFEKSYSGSPGIVVSDQSGVSPRAGQEVINKRFLGFLGQSVSLLSENALSVSEVILPLNTVRQVEFKIEGESYKIKMTVDRDAGAQVEQALLATKYIDDNAIAPEYIDVRADQRVFYK